MPRTTFPIQTFQDSEGLPLSFGYILVRLNEDAKTPDPAQIGAQLVSQINLDTNGTIIGSPMFWPNASLQPSDTVYLLSSYTSNGEQVLYNESITV